MKHRKRAFVRLLASNSSAPRIARKLKRPARIRIGNE